ncbi:MAG: hypothetical protein ABI277_17840, partial [Burkholderiaceae bacterium]
ILLHLLGLVTLAMPRHWHDTQFERIAAIAALAFLFTSTLSAAMSRVVAAFHERRDLDLLLGAPIAPMLILVIRALTVVAAVTALFAVFVYPVVDVGVANGRWWLARLYLLVPLMATLSTGVALMLTGAVVRLIGVRRARVGLQVFSALIGASMYLVSQARHVVPDGVATRVQAWSMDVTRGDDLPLPVALAAGLADGDMRIWVAFAIVAIGVFVLSVRLARTGFIEVAQQPEADARVVVPKRAAVDRRIAKGFGNGLFGTLLVKEWRLILRAPQLISQVLLQLFYLLPLLFVAFARNDAKLSWSASAFTAGIVGVSATLATSLAWLTVSAEGAPDLLIGSPKQRSVILAAKLTASTLPPLLLVAIAAIGTAQRAPFEAAVVLVYGFLACASAAILSAAAPVTGKRSDFQRRHQGRKLSALVEAVQFLLWAAAAGTAVSGLWIVAIIATLFASIMPALRLPLALRATNRRIGDA